MDEFTGFMIFVIFLLAWINKDYITSLFNNNSTKDPNNDNISMDNLPMTIDGVPVNGNITLKDLYKMKIMQSLNSNPNKALYDKLMVTGIKVDATKNKTTVPSYGTSVNEMETPVSPPLLQTKPTNPTVGIMPVYKTPATIPVASLQSLSNVIAPTNSNISLQTAAPTMTSTLSPANNISLQTAAPTMTSALAPANKVSLSSIANSIASVFGVNK